MLLGIKFKITPIYDQPVMLSDFSQRNFHYEFVIIVEYENTW